MSFILLQYVIVKQFHMIDQCSVHVSSMSSFCVLHRLICKYAFQSLYVTEYLISSISGDGGQGVENI